jgi:UPF0755 protein
VKRRAAVAGAVLLAVMVFAAVLGNSWWSRMNQPVTEEPHPKRFEIAAGATLKGVAVRLEAEGIVRSARAVEWTGRARGLEHEIRAGRYVVSSSESPGEILDRFVRGETEPIRVKFVEGIWLTEVAPLIADSLDLNVDEVLARANDRSFLAGYGIDADNAEGYLFPDTYEFEGGERIDAALARLIDAGREVRARFSGARDSLDLSWHELLTLASIIESETGVADERFKVSAVYHQRLRRGMLLQADPTLIYGLGLRGHELTRANLNTDGPYNTYLRKGLPPGPIGNPGLAAIEAAVRPDPECTALYFVAKPGGGHTFSDTYEQHLVAVRAWRNR